MKYNTLAFIFAIFLIIACKHEIKDELSIIDNSKVQKDLRMYIDYENRFINIIDEKKLDLQRIYSDSANFYDSILNQNVSELSKEDLYNFNDVVKKLKMRKIEALKKQ